MNKFTHGVIVLLSDNEDEASVVHFIGLWNEPTDDDIEHFKNELKNDPDFGLSEIFDELEFLIASTEQVEMFNKIMSNDLEDINTIHLN